MKKSEVTDEIKKRMSDSDLAQLFGVSRTPDPIGTSNDQPSRALRAHDQLEKLEKQDHVEVENWLNQHELWYDHQMMHKRTRNKVGNPDFAIGIEGLLVCIELKRPGRELTPEQESQRSRCLGPSKCQYHVCYSGKEAIEILQKILKIT